MKLLAAFLTIVEEWQDLFPQQLTSQRAVAGPGKSANRVLRQLGISRSTLYRVLGNEAVFSG